MTHQVHEEAGSPARLAEIIARDETNPGIGRQMLNGLGGLLLLLGAGIVVVLLVLWKAP